jgi:hypothetical protein
MVYKGYSTVAVADLEKKVLLPNLVGTTSQNFKDFSYRIRLKSKVKIFVTPIDLPCSQIIVTRLLLFIAK